MKEAMLRRPKYVAVVNNYGDAEETIEYLTKRGNLKLIRAKLTFPLLSLHSIFSL